jgi:mannose-6-phosphate isomerase-like protein (cupin superfamily)
MENVIKYLQLPFFFSEEKLLCELNKLNEQWIMHFNTAHYDGEWSALPLRSLNGSLTNVLPENHEQGRFVDTVLMERCPYIRSIVAQFPCELQAVRLLKLNAGAIIKEHRDSGLCFEQGEARIHVPITTNDRVEFYLDNERMIVRPGECWYMNFNLPHRIANYGATDRVHLVIDMIVNDPLSDIFAQVSVENKKIIGVKDPFSPDERRQMIERLREMNTPASIKLAEEMELPQ